MGKSSASAVSVSSARLSSAREMRSSLDAYLPRHGDALLIVPPFALADRPSLAAHLLQACARESGFEVRVLYANLSLAASISIRLYNAICHHNTNQALLGERFFSRAAFGVALLGRQRDRLRLEFDHLSGNGEAVIEWSEYERAARGASSWADDIAAAVAHRQYPVVGATTSYLQTCASIAILDRIKERSNDVITILGGTSCDGDMAEGLAAVAPGIDHIVSGEGESSFPGLLRKVRAGERPLDRIIIGEPCPDLDRLPTPDYAEYFDQLDLWLPEAPVEAVWLPYESSRGCWWGQRRRCTFCGLNIERTSFREKSPTRVARDLTDFSRRHPARRVAMADNAMPRSYVRSLLPRLDAVGLGLRIFYYQRPDLSLDQVAALARAGITTIQAGIEALSPSLLDRLDKGTSVARCIALLRYARSLRIGVYWNLLFQVPGDTLEEYEETLALLPLLRHLSPASNLIPIGVDRFSRYFDRPGDFSIRDVRPLEEYACVFPEAADTRSLAYHFTGEYPSASREHPEIIDRLAGEIETARALWARPSGPPLLYVRRLGVDVYGLLDSRGVSGASETRLLVRDQAGAAVAGGPSLPPSAVEWAISCGVGVQLGGRYIPLATAEPDLLAELESDSRRGDRRSA